MKRLISIDRVLNIATFVVLALVVFVLFMPGHGPLARAFVSWRHGQTMRSRLKIEWPVLATTGLLLADSGAYSTASAAEADLVIFTDYQCPFCRRLDKELNSLAAGRRLPNVRMHQLPLSIHPAARLAAVAAICADHVGQFRRMHDYLMATEEWQTNPTVVEIAKGAKITETGAFERCVGSALPDSIIASDSIASVRLEMSVTPTIVSRGGLVYGTVSADSVLILAKRPR